MSLRTKVNSIALTLSGNEITDAVRTTGTEGDGLAVPAGMGVWEASDNLLDEAGIEVSFETDLNGWNQTGNAEIRSRITSNAQFGVGSMQLLHDGTAGVLGGHTDNVTVDAGGEYTASVWVYPTVGTVGNMAVKIRETTGGTAATQATFTGLSLNTWTRVSVTHTMGGSVSTVRVEVVHNSGSNLDSFVADGVQLEKQPIATPFMLDDRSAARVQIPVAGLFTETQGWWAARTRMGFVSTSIPAGAVFLFDWRDDSDNTLETFYDGTNWAFDRDGVDTNNTVLSVADTFSEGDNETITGAWTAANIRLSVDGGAFSQRANTGIPSLASTTVDIGSLQGSSAFNFDSNILWAVFGAGTLTDADAATINAAGNSPGEAESMVKGLGPAANPTAFYDGVNSNVYSVVFSHTARKRELERGLLV